MALGTPVVTIQTLDENGDAVGAFVTEPQEKLYSIPLLLVVPDDSAGYDGIKYTTSVSFPAAANVADYVDMIIAEFQQEIDRYEHSKTVQESASLASALLSIVAGLSV